MRRHQLKKYFLIASMVMVFTTSFSFAKNVGTIGQVYPIVEDDFLEFIESRALLAQQNGALNTLQHNMKNRAETYRDRPTPAKEITHATESKSWTFDPSIVLDHDVITPDRKVIAKEGAHINPLLYVPLSKPLIFYDADDKKEQEWVLELDKKLKGKDKIILVKGSILQEEKRLQKQIYFDQAGRLVSRFGIKHVPAIVNQEGSLLRVSEVKP